MPIEYRIDHVRRLVLARASGVLTDDEVFGYQNSAWAGAEVAGYDELVDMTDVQRVALPSVDRMRDLARLSAGMDRGGRSKFVIVAPGDIAFMLGRLYKAIRGVTGGTRQVGVFRSEQEAMEFLARPPAGSGPRKET